MTKQNQDEAQVGIKYTSTGYAEAIKELQHLQNLIQDVNTAANKVKGGTRAVKGMQNSLNILQSLNLGSQVFGGPKQNFEQRALAEAMSKLIANVQQHSKLGQNQLRLLAYTGQLSQEQLNLHKGNTETLKAIQAGYNDALRGNSASVKQNKLQLELHNQVTKILEDTVKQKKDALRLERANETKKRLQERKVALRFAEEVATKGSSKGLTGYIGQASKVQLEALERALNAQTLKSGGFDKRAIESALGQVSQAKTALSFGTQIIDPSKVIEIIKGSKGQKGTSDAAIKDLRDEISRQRKVGADKETLRNLYQILADARTAAVEVHKPISPYQRNKQLNEEAAKRMGMLTEAQIKGTGSIFELEQHRRASQIRAKDTAVTFNSNVQKAEAIYQKMLQQRISELEEAKLTTKREQAKRVKDEAKAASTVYGESLTKIKSGDVLGGLEGLSLRQLKKLQTQLFSHLDLTGLDAKVKENFKKALGQIDTTLKAAKRGDLTLLGLEAPDVNKPLKKDKKLNIFEKARQGQLTVKELQDFQAASVDPRRTLKELRSIQTQLRKAELDPNLITTTDKAPEKLGNFIRTQISSLNQVINDLDKAAKPAKPVKVKDWTTQTRESVRADINTLGQSGDPTARQNIRDAAKRNFQTKQNQEEYNKELIRHKASVTQATIQQMTNSAELAKATQAIKLDNKLHPKNQDANLALIEAIKQRTKELNYQAKLRDPNFAASEALKQNQAGLRTANVNSLLQGQDLNAARQVAKINGELEKQKAIQAGIFDSADKLKALKAEEHKFARDTLNYQYEMNKHDKTKRDEASRLLAVLSDIQTAHKKSINSNQTIADLEKTHYRTKEDLKRLSKDESALAMQVIKYRRDTLAVGEAEWRAQQKLYDLAQRQHQLETIRAHTRDRERQEARREGQREHVLGDAGASLMLIQGALKINYAMLGGVQSIFSGAFDAATKLDSAFRNLQAISASTNAEMATMKVNLINVAQASKFSAAEVGETTVLLAQAGLSIQEIGASMKGIVTLAQATGTDLARSVDVVTSILSIFNKSATETDTIVNQLTQALNRSKLDIQKMALGLQYAGNIANDSGVSFEELTAALGATANAGIRSGSTLGTGLRQMFIDLQKPSEKLQARLNQLGISLDQVNFRSQGLEGVLRNLREAGFTSADAFATFQVRSAAAFSALSGNLDDFHQLQEELSDTNAAFEANNVQMESLAVQIDHLKSNLGILAAEGLKPITALLRDLAKATSHAMENAEEGSGVLQVFSTALTSILFGVAIGWMAKMAIELLRIVKAATTAAGALGLLRGAMTLSNPVAVGLVAAIGLATAAFVSHSNEVERLNTVLDKLKGAHNKTKEEINSIEGNITNLDAAMTKLNHRYGQLINSQSDTTAFAKELRREFGGLGLEIDDLANVKVPELIAKLDKLHKQEIARLRVKNIQELDENLAKLKGQRDADAAAMQEAGRYFNTGKGASDVVKMLQNPRAALQASLSRERVTIPISNMVDSLKNEPELKKVVAEIFKGVALAHQTMGGFKDSQLNPMELQRKLTEALTRTNVSAEERRRVEDLTTKAFNTIEALQRNFTAPEVESSLRKNQKNTDRRLEVSSIVTNDTRYAQGQAQAIFQQFQQDITNNSINTRDIKLRQVQAVAIAKKALKELEAQKASVIERKKAIKALEQTDETRLDLSILTDQETAIAEHISTVEKAAFEDKKELLKRQVKSARNKLDALKEEEDLAKQEFNLTTGLNSANKKKTKYEEASQAVRNQEKVIFDLENKDNPLRDLDLEAFNQQQEAKQKQLKNQMEQHFKAINNRATENKAKNIKDATEDSLEKRSKAHQDFLAAQKERDRAFQDTEESLARQHKAGKYRPLVNTDMSYLNKEEKKRAQAAANTTGVAQEYSVFGQVKNTFAKQGENYRQEQNETAIAQRKLLHNLEQLQTAELIKQSFNLDEYNKLLDEQKVKQEALDKLKAAAQNADKDFDQTKLDAAETELKALNEKITLQAKIKEETAQEVRERELAVRLAQDELDKLKEKWGVMSTTILAGVQSLESGMSTIFSDWASGVIENTEDVKEAFRSLGQSILQSMLKVVSDKLAQQFVGFLLNTVGGLGGASGASAPSDFGAAIVGQTPSISFGMAKGGLVKRFAEGGFVSGTSIGRDSVPALLMPDEYVLQRSAVSALGKPFLDNLNQVTAGSISQGKTALTGSAPQINNVMKSSPPVNVYVVAPEQQRQMSQQDVVVALQDDILRNGQTKKLIKGIITGEV